MNKEGLRESMDGVWDWRRSDEAKKQKSQGGALGGSPVHHEDCLSKGGRGWIGGWLDGGV